MGEEFYRILLGDLDIQDFGSRRSVYTSIAHGRGFVQKQSESTIFKKFSDVVEFFNALRSETQFSENTSVPPTLAVSTTSITVFELPLPEWITRSDIPIFSGYLTRNIDSQHRSLLSGVNQTSTTGRLFSKDQHSVLFETPKNSVPYMKFWLKKVETEGIQEEWLALLAYDKESYLGMIPFGIFDLHMKSYTDIDDADPSSAKAPSKFFVELLHQYIRMYVAIVETERKGFMEAINKVEDSLNSDQRPSSLLRSLNTISRRIRAASLEIKLTFSKDAAEWAKDISASQFHAPITSEKPFLAQDIEQYHPDRLREVAAEVHQHIEDVIAERQQERQEKLQELEDVRRKEEWELLQQNLEIAKATQRDSRLMSGVAWVTMAFLPATFVSSFFGMNFFNGIAGDVPFDEASRSVWLFFVIAIPTSAFVLLTFYVWNEKQKKEDEHKRKLREKTTREDTASEDAAKRKTYEGTTVTSTGNDVEPPGLRQRM